MAAGVCSLPIWPPRPPCQERSRKARHMRVRRDTLSATCGVRLWQQASVQTLCLPAACRKDL